MPVKAVYGWLRWLSRRRWHVLAVVLGGIALLVALAALLARSEAEQRRNRRETYEAILDLDRVFGDLRDAETGQRGFLLALGDAAYLEPYLSAVGQFADHMVEVRTYQPFSRTAVNLLNSHARDKLAELATTIQLWREGRRDDALAMVRTGRGKQIMDMIRATINDMADGERRRLTASEAAIGATRLQLYAATTAAAASLFLTIAGLVVVYRRDERERIAAELRHAAAAVRFLAINRAAPAAIITSDGRGVIVEWNAAAEHIFGWTEAEAVGQSLSMLIPERHRAAHRAGMAAAIARGAVANHGPAAPTEALRKDGTEFPAEVYVEVFPLDGVPHAVGIVRDVTARRAMELALAARQGELERSNEDLRQFAYVASHDLKEPLRTLETFMGRLMADLDGELAGRAAENAGFVVAAARRMDSLISDLLAYSRIDLKPDPHEPVALEAVLDGAIRPFDDMLDRDQAQVRMATALPAVYGEPFALGQLLQNLVANGLKFRRPGVTPVVTVACSGLSGPRGEPGDTHHHLAVVDNGIGIDAAGIPKLFRLFTRLHAPADFEGTGVGLAICKKIVERHGGQIWIESEPGRGSAFHFTLAREKG